MLAALVILCDDFSDSSKPFVSKFAYDILADSILEFMLDRIFSKFLFYRLSLMNF